ncbi:MAG: sugar phosphate isomerase/epimerase [Oscillospiraceae bacterium]|nr:sugar phosphate isomerase/epimerase [Oscillospiraceae bacterium]
MKIGLQIYTLRDIISEGYEKILKETAEIGYKGVEMTYSPDDGELVAGLLKKYGLVCTGAHISIDELENNPQRAAGFLDKMGSKHMIIPWIDGKLIDTEEAAVKTALRMEEGAKKAASHGYILSFHNHTIEFEKKFGEKTVMDIFYERAPSLKFEIDCGWAFAGGADVCAVLDKFGERVSFIHIKDVDENKTPTEVGSGRVDMGAVIKTASKYGVEWGVVEQDTCTNYKPLEAVKISFDYIKTIN